jgi:hypothetical protein
MCIEHVETLDVSLASVRALIGRIGLDSTYISLVLSSPERPRELGRANLHNLKAGQVRRALGSTLPTRLTVCLENVQLFCRTNLLKESICRYCSIALLFIIPPENVSGLQKIKHERITLRCPPPRPYLRRI